MHERLDKRKLVILRHLIELGAASVAELQRHTSIPRSSLTHHLNMLVKRGYLLQERSGKKLVSRVVPQKVQQLRRMMKLRAPVALISGYTYDPNKPDERTLEVLDRAVRLLGGAGVRVERRVAFTTPLAREMIARTEWQRGEEEIVLDIEVYQNDIARLTCEMQGAVERLLPEYEPVVDLTPLTKLFTIAGLNAASKYCLRAIYHGGSGVLWVDAASVVF